jgi:hypothetical protein
MNSVLKGALVAALVMPALAFGADPPKNAGCYEIRYSSDFLDKYPMAPAICDKVVEKDGVKYAHMSATIVKRDGPSYILGFKNVFGTKILELEVQPAEGSKVSIGGKPVAWSMLKLGDSVGFYLPEKALYIVQQPGDGVLTPIIIRSKSK